MSTALLYPNLDRSVQAIRELEGAGFLLAVDAPRLRELAIQQWE